MTNEEIERALECCACIHKNGCNDCPVVCEKNEQYACTIKVAQETLAYIVRLKNDILCEENKAYNTAKDILQDWYNDVKGMGEDGHYIKLIAKQYGVTIEE